MFPLAVSKFAHAKSSNLQHTLAVSAHASDPLFNLLKHSERWNGG